MDIQLFAGDKEIIAPLFDFRINSKPNFKETLILSIANFSEQEQDNFLSIIKNININNLYINSDYIAITTTKEIYFFSLENYKEHKFENALISGYYNLSFAFINLDDKIIDRDYLVMELNGYKFKEL